jgi:zinc-ribbon domain
MPRTHESDADWDDDESEWTPDEDNEDSEDWGNDDDDDNTVECPHCHAAVYEGAEQCPQCGNYLSEEDAPREVKPLWIIVGGLLCLAIVVLWIWKG